MGLWNSLKNIYSFLSGDGSQHDANRNERSAQSFLNTQRRTPSSPLQRPETYRPKPKSGTSQNIRFTESTPSTKAKFTDIGDSSSSNNLKPQSFNDIRDAFTGALIDLSSTLYQCDKCSVYYLEESYQVIREVNSGKCMACLSTSIVKFSEGRAPKNYRNYTADIVTLQNFKDHVGNAVVFEGLVHKVLISRDGLTRAVMFENKSWTRGLKLVVFRGCISRVGGSSYLDSLENRTIRVRGLLTLDPRFGHEIIIKEREMILEVR